MTRHTSPTRRPLVIGDAVTMLARTPGVLHALLHGLPDDWTTATEGVDTWSPFDVIAHLIHGERANWMPRAKLILEHGDARAFEPFDRLAQFRESEGRTLASLLSEFTTVRQQSIGELEALRLTASDLDRHGRHPEFGRVTLRQLMATWVAHDLDHIVQISRTLARQYSDEVGPWRAYLRIINETRA